jgi:hypothetical protein
MVLYPCVDVFLCDMIEPCYEPVGVAGSVYGAAGE